MKVGMSADDTQFKKVLSQIENRVTTKGARDGLEAGYAVFEGEAVQLIQNPPKTGVKYGAHQASAPGESPATDTGFLAASRTRPIVKMAGNRSSIEGGFGAEYAADLEFGTPKMAARPYVRPGLFNNENKIWKAFAFQITKAIRMFT